MYNPSMAKETARRFPHIIVLNRHPDHRPGKSGDPRKIWLYDGFVSGPWRVQPVGFDKPFMPADQFEYMFSNEEDALLFELKWLEY